MKRQYKTKRVMGEELFDDPFERLAFAIINQGAEDLKRVLQGRPPTYFLDNRNVNKKELEQFFNGEWFMFLSGIDPQGEDVFGVICEKMKV